MNEAHNKWANFYKTEQHDWPSEILVRLLKGSYIPGLDRDYAGRKAIDVGFGSGNNLMFLASLGLSVSGTEVEEDICERVRERLAALGWGSDLGIGTNRNIPFPDNEFDFLVSWNVIHYEDNEVDMRLAIAEYARVMKPGGRFIISTAGPEDKIMTNSSLLGNHRYQIGLDDDFRKGQVFFYFESPVYIHYYFGEHFADVLVGRARDDLFTVDVDSFIVTGVKPE